jgi:hypothetical protein
MWLRSKDGCGKGELLAAVDAVLRDEQFVKEIVIRDKTRSERMGPPRRIWGRR